MTAKDLRRLAGQVFADLGRARVTPREALVFEQLIRVTLGRGRQSVRILRREVWGRFGLSKGNVSDVLNGLPGGSPGLIALGMVQVAGHPDGGELWSVLPDAAQWRCGWRFERSAQAEFLADLDAVAGQVQAELLPREPDLADAMALVSLESAARSITSAERHRVPESGTLLRPVPTLGTVAAPRANAVQVTSKPVLPASEKELKAGKTGVQVNRGEEGAVLDRVRVFLESSPHVADREDFAHWSGYWRMKVVRPNPGLVAKVLDEFQAKQREGWEAERSRVAALKDLLRRWS